jgi:hypothetical protein
MRNVLLRSPLICSLVLTIVSISFACSESIASFRFIEVRSPKEMKFNFEDYDVKSPEVVQEKLSQLFPKGSSLSEFQSFMERSGSKCYFNEEIDGNFMNCRQLVGKGLFVKSEWIVTVQVGKDNKVGELTIEAAFTGP